MVIINTKDISQADRPMDAHRMEGAIIAKNPFLNRSNGNILMMGSAIAGMPRALIAVIV